MSLNLVQQVISVVLCYLAIFNQFNQLKKRKEILCLIERTYVLSWAYSMFTDFFVHNFESFVWKGIRLLRWSHCHHARIWWGISWVSRKSSNIIKYNLYRKFDYTWLHHKVAFWYRTAWATPTVSFKTL